MVPFFHMKVGGKGVGGIIGVLGGESCVVSQCFNSGSVSGNRHIGGIVGHIGGKENQVNNCVNNGSIKGSRSGGIVGEVEKESPVIQHCINNGTIQGKSQYTGGIAGVLIDIHAKIMNCQNNGTVFGDSDELGGIVGHLNYLTSVENCQNTGTVTGSGKIIGGIVGGFGGIVTQSTNRGNVLGENNTTIKIGGIVGELYEENDQETGSDIIACYNAGNLCVQNVEDAYIGGIVGNLELVNNVSNINRCYSKGEITTKEISGNLNRGELIGYTSSLENITKLYYYNALSEGIGAVNGKDYQEQEVERTEQIFNSLEEFLTWLNA